MRIRSTLVGCLAFSGLSALVYQVVWTRLLGFAFGTTTEAIATVLAVFFGGMALGNWAAARHLARVSRPLRMYGWLELWIGGFALASLPVLQRLDGLYALVGADHGPMATIVLRAIAAGLLLLPPTLAMGATLPVVARGLVERDETLGRWSAVLYAANALGAVMGAYLCGFWLVPWLGLSKTVILAALVNLGVAGAALHYGSGVRVARAGSANAVPTQRHESPDRTARRWFLAFFAVSGFAAIGYEIAWSKVFTIVMEGTLYGYSTVLSAYLLGLALGSLAMARFVDRIRDLPRAFGLLHAAIGASVALGTLAVGDLPYWHHRIASLGWDHGVHALFLLAAPIVLLPTALFGAAFPLLIRIYTARASEVGEGMGTATAVNTAGSIAASLLLGFAVIPMVGIDATLYGLVLLELALAVVVLARFQTSPGRQRALATGGAFAVLLSVALSFNGVHVERAVAGHFIESDTLEGYRARLEDLSARTALVLEGRSSIVTVHTKPSGWSLRTNGMPEAGFSYGPPYRGLETRLLAILPYLVAERSERALVIGFGGGATLDALLETPVRSIDVVELEENVIEARHLLYTGREDPFDDPRVSLRVNDGRNELLVARHRGEQGWDLIASQPSHPWLAGAANLFTEEFFRLARAQLAPGGVFALWINGFHGDAASLLAVTTSFERIFPGSALAAASGENPHAAFLLLGGTEPIRWPAERAARRFADPRIREVLALHDIETIEQLLARFEATGSALAAIAPDASNTDDNAFVETRLSRRLTWDPLDYREIEARLDRDAQVLPPIDGPLDTEAVARAMLEAPAVENRPPYLHKLERFVRVHADTLSPLQREELVLEAALLDPERATAAETRLSELATSHPERPEALRALGRHAALRTRDFRVAGERFGEAWKRSRAHRDAYDAARAWHYVDFARAVEWMDRIPPEERDSFPRLALFAAERALRGGAPARELERHFEALLAYRDTDEGRRFAGVDAALGRLAAAVGDDPAARAYADSDRQSRSARAEPLFQSAKQSLALGDLDAARSNLTAASVLLPTDLRFARLAARIAAARGDTRALDLALAKLEHWTPNLRDGIGEVNRLRAELGMELLPLRKLTATAGDDRTDDASR